MRGPPKLGRDDDALVWSEEPTSPEAVDEPDPWLILVVDDDLDIHHATQFALYGVTIFDRRVRLLHAHSAQQAIDILKSEPNIAIVLLDVVMDTDSSGLDLVRYIREDLKRGAVRIILRTGQPGFAPELEVIRRYDINDYRTKVELTRTRLLTTLTTAIRSYLQIEVIEASRRGLTQIVGASADLFSERSIARFANGVLTQLRGFMPGVIDGLVMSGAGETEEEQVPTVLAGTGRRHELIGQTLDQLADDDLKQRLSQALKDGVTRFDDASAVLPIRTPSGETAVIYVATRRALDSADRQLVGLFATNIAIGFDNARLFERTQQLAFIDQLTGLANRTRFLEVGDVALASREPHGLYLIDLDGFQSVNDGLGGDAGNLVLRSIAQLLSEVMNEAVVVARLSGDLFGVVALADSEDMIDATLMRLASCFEEPLTIGDLSLPVAATIGFAVDAGSKATTMLQHASIALKQGKRDRRGGATRFASEMDLILRQHVALVSRLRGALAGGQFQAFLQPIVRLPDGKLMGAEALLRWRTPSGELVPPEQFIRAAEESGMIVALGDWVLCEVCRLMNRFDQAGMAPLKFAVNVSMRQFREAGFVGRVGEILKTYKIDPSRLNIEITESTLMEDFNGLIDALRALRKMGLSLSIDDFGTGYSSLSYLLNLPVTKLKIDKSFVAEIDRRRESRSIASMIVTMAKELGVGVVAEGVESTAHEAVLIGLGCDEAQGWLYAQAMPAEAFEVFARTRAIQ
ncbi:MAG: EAL domain-containing protein [Elsteraceae bacterium]